MTGPQFLFPRNEASPAVVNSSRTGQTGSFPPLYTVPQIQSDCGTIDRARGFSRIPLIDSWFRSSLLRTKHSIASPLFRPSGENRALVSASTGRRISAKVMDWSPNYTLGPILWRKCRCMWLYRPNAASMKILYDLLDIRQWQGDEAATRQQRQVSMGTAEV